MKIKLTHLILSVLAVFFYNGLLAQDGANDPTFNPSDTGYSNGADGEIRSGLALSDGKIVIVGQFNNYFGVSRSKIARINADKSLDTSFTPGTGANNTIEVLLRQPDGKIIIGGQFTKFNDVSRNRIARLNANGSLDESFNPGTGANDLIKSLALQSDGKILIGGDFTVFNDTTVNRMVRLNADGTVDTSFSVTGVNNTINSIAVQSDGKILVVGAFTMFNGSLKNYLVRLNVNGTTDNTFIGSIEAGHILYAVKVNTSDEIYVGGFFTLMKFNGNGSANAAFSGGVQQGVAGTVYSIALQPDGKIIAVGQIGGYNNDYSVDSVVRVNGDGTRDVSFVSPEGVDDWSIHSVILKQDGKIIIVGRFLIYNNKSENYITVLNANGTKDVSFDSGPGTGADNYVRASVLQLDKKIIIGGDFNYYNGVSRNKIARLNPDGTIDESFTVGSGFDSYVSILKLQSDGKILVGGEFKTFKGELVKDIVRLNVDGSLDPSFNFTVPYGNVGPGDYLLHDIAVQVDGKILVAAYFSTAYPNGVYICRLNPDGSHDTTFTVVNVDRPVSEIIIQPDNKILLALSSSYTVGSSEPSVMRLNNNGTIDTSFTVVPLSYIQFCNDIALQPDGKIIISGFGYYDDVFKCKIARINANGTFDETFTEGNLDYTAKIELQHDGKLIAANFYKHNNVAVNGLIRLDQNGNIDTTFNSGTATYSPYGVFSMLFQEHDKIIITGWFVAYNGIGRNRIARVNTSGAMNVETFTTNATNVIAYRDNNALQVNSSDKEIKSVMVYDLSGRLVAENRNVRATSVSLNNSVDVNTILIVKVKMTDGTQSVKKIYY